MMCVMLNAMYKTTKESFNKSFDSVDGFTAFPSSQKLYVKFKLKETSQIRLLCFRFMFFNPVPHNLQKLGYKALNLSKRSRNV